MNQPDISTRRAFGCLNIGAKAISIIGFVLITLIFYYIDLNVVKTVALISGIIFIDLSGFVLGWILGWKKGYESRA